MRDLSAVMVTVDRSPEPNYLAETLANLKRSDLETSERLDSLFISCSDDGEWAANVCDGLEILDTVVGIGGFVERHCANLNVANALRVGAGGPDHWVLFLEDDIDVCAGFFDSVGAWLDEHARDDRRVVSFACPYDATCTIAAYGEHVWDYPITRFYGTQCFAIRSTDALDLAEYLETHCHDLNPEGVCYDLLMHCWSESRWPNRRHFQASCPSLVQHIGMTSVISPRENIHTSPSWPGRDWSYLNQETQQT